MLPTTTDEHMLEIFSRERGFKKLSIICKNQAATCWVEFSDPGTAASAMARHQGAITETSASGGLKIQFAKKKTVEPKHPKRH